MRSFRHLTPRYVVDRMREITYQRSHPDEPWLTREANSILKTLLLSSDRGLEFGSGRSTLWFARRVAHLTSVEHDPAWYARISAAIESSGLSNVEYRLGSVLHGAEGSTASEYVQTANLFEAESLDFVLVDGIYRDDCAIVCLEKLRPGGILIIDNVNWYLPSGSISPSSRRMGDGPDGEGWERVARAVSGWRRIWTTSGVTDTAFFFRPCPPRSCGSREPRNPQDL